MSQRRFFDPEVSVAPNLVGIGNGTLSVDKLTHFTTAQTYTLTCIQKTPDTIFAVVASLDGPVGLATVGIQYFDEDLKVFLTITQGSTPFEVGDVFTFSVVNGTDLNQDNIDDYDEEPQKNFGVGNKGDMSGDHNIRINVDNQFSQLIEQSILFKAVTAGVAADLLNIQFLNTIPAVAATLSIEGFNFTAVTPGAAGNSIQIEFVDDVLAGAEYVAVLGNLITVHINAGTTTRSIVDTELGLVPAVATLVTYTFSSGGTLVAAQPATNLINGADPVGAEGDEEAFITGNNITVRLATGRSTLQSVKTAMDANATILALVTTTILGKSDDIAYAMGAAEFLVGAEDKEYALNKDELANPGDFVEGNADALLNDAHIQRDLTVDKKSRFKDSVSLESTDSEKVSDVQDYINRLIQDQKIALRTADHTKVQWSQPNFSYEADIHIEFTDTDFINKINVSESPISVSDGQSIYVILDRKSTRYVEPFVATTIPKNVNAFRLLSRFGDNVILWDNTLVRDGKGVRIGEGGEGGTVKVDLYDPVSTTLPVGVSATIDGVSVTNGMQVLFSNLSVNNNRVYKVTGVGVALVWTAQSVWSTGLDPINGDDVIVIQGSGFARADGIFDGSDFQFSDRKRFYNGVDYWEVSNLKQTTLADNTTGDVFSIAYAGSENIFVDYSISRSGDKRAGTIVLTTDGTLVALYDGSAEMVPELGVLFDSDISGANIRLRYTTTNTGAAATMKYVLRRWSDSAGGPGGLPSYSGPGGTPAAGADTQIQFNDSGALGADSDFTWNKTSNIMGMSGTQHSGLQASITLNDNTTDGVALSYNAASFPSMIMEYSAVRDGERRTGTIMISTNGTDISINDQSTETNPTGITFDAQLNAGNVELLYTTTSTTFNATFKHQFRRWS